MTEKNGEIVQRWLPVVVMFLSCLVTVAVAWGSLTARMSAVEQMTRDSITRFEYNDLKARLDRIEAKLDAELSKKQ